MSGWLGEREMCRQSEWLGGREGEWLGGWEG